MYVVDRKRNDSIKGPSDTGEKAVLISMKRYTGLAKDEELKAAFLVN